MDISEANSNLTGFGGDASENANTNANAAGQQLTHTKSNNHGKSEGTENSRKDWVSSSSPSGNETSPAQITTPPGRKCLTNPSTPYANENRDNKEGNLIVFESDVFRIPKEAIRSHTGNIIDRKHSKVEFKVLRLLGQGTFAQVFKCKDLATGKLVAVKVVKNKTAYTKQAAVEIDVFRAMMSGEDQPRDTMVTLLCYFMHQEHLCLVFELLGLNLYEVLKRRQFLGLPMITVRALVRQALEGVRELTKHNVVHCDLKPENILLVNDKVMHSLVNTRKSEHKSPSKGSASSSANGPSPRKYQHTAPAAHEWRIKLIDFGSACFEGRTAHTYIQSRFYRSPEVLVGLPYDSAIDMWSLGCVAAELYLGLPILPGVHEHDQLGRIYEMIGPLPKMMIDEGSKSSKYFVKELSRNNAFINNFPIDPSTGVVQSPLTWRLKTRQEFIQSLSEEEKKKRGGIEKLEKPANRYFRDKKLEDILILHGERHCSTEEEKEMLMLFVHFLKGVLNPDPWKRWTAYQASMHPFITGTNLYRRDSRSDATFDVLWVPPSDPAVYHRKLNAVQKRERQKLLMRRNYSGSSGTTRQPSTRSVPVGLVDHQLASRSADPVGSVADMVGMPRLGSLPDSILHGGAASQFLNPSATALNRHESPPSSINVNFPDSGVASLQFDGGLSRLGLLNEASQASRLVSSQQLGELSRNSMTRGDSFIDRYQRTLAPAPPSIGAQLNALDKPLSTLIASQSFSGLNFNGGDTRQFRGEGDFGYALQRPGVVPGMGNDLSNPFPSAHQSRQNAIYPNLSPTAGFQRWTVGGASAVGARNPMIVPSSHQRRPRYSIPSQFDPGLPPLFNVPTSAAENTIDPVIPQASALGMDGMDRTRSLLAQQLSEQQQQQQMAMSATLDSIGHHSCQQSLGSSELAQALQIQSQQAALSAAALDPTNALGTHLFASPPQQQLHQQPPPGLTGLTAEVLSSQRELLIQHQQMLLQMQGLAAVQHRQQQAQLSEVIHQSEELLLRHGYNTNQGTDSFRDPSNNHLNM